MTKSINDRRRHYLGLVGLKPKCPIYLLEFPFFHPARRVNYTRVKWQYLSSLRDGVKNQEIEICPTKHGRPTIYDLDLMIYLTSQIIGAGENGLVIENPIRFSPHNFLEFSSRSRSVKEYSRLTKTLDRLTGTLFSTNVTNVESSEMRSFHLLDSWRARNKNGRLANVEIYLSNWFLEICRPNQVLTIDHEYFNFKSEFERRLYLIYSKHIGKSSCWQIKLEKLFIKHGYGGSERSFKFKLVNKSNLIKGYRSELLGRDVVHVYRSSQKDC